MTSSKEETVSRSDATAKIQASDPNARLYFASEFVQDLAYDLTTEESPTVIAELIQMSYRLYKIRETRLGSDQAERNVED